jgi:pimeloyl-ACP methyl ester carboxylesterase
MSEQIPETDAPPADRTDPAEGYFDVPGGRLHYLDWGPPGRPIHFLHGNGFCAGAYAPFLARLTPELHVTASDIRGHGGSAFGPMPRIRHWKVFAEDLAVLLRGLQHGPVIGMGHSLGAHIAVRFAAHHPELVDRLILFDGGLDVRAEVLDSLAPAVNRLGVEFPSLEAFLGLMQTLPMFAGRWNEHLARYFTYDVEPGPGGGVRSKVVRHAIEEEVANLQRVRLWVWHHKITAPTLLFRAPDGLLTPHDCLMTQDEAEAMAHAIRGCRLVVVPGTNHYTVLLGGDPVVKRESAAFLAR